MCYNSACTYTFPKLVIRRISQPYAFSIATFWSFFSATTQPIDPGFIIKIFAILQKQFSYFDAGRFGAALLENASIFNSFFTSILESYTKAKILFFFLAKL